MKPGVAIVGAGLGGLSAAIHLRNAGFPVTVFEANPLTGGRANAISRDGFHFDTGPSLVNYPWVFEELFASAGRRLSDYVTLLPVDPTVQFRWPDGTSFSLSSDIQRLLAECERLEPGSSAAALRWLRDACRKYDVSFAKLVTRNEDDPLRWIGRLSPREIWNSGVWRSLDGELRRFFRNRYIREALGSYGMYLGGSPYELPGLFSILAYGELAYGLWLPKGGVHGLVRGMERLARELGADIQTSQPVRRILTENGRAAGVELATGAVKRFAIVVSNVDAPFTNEHLLGLAKPRKQPRMTPGVLTFYWGMRGRPEAAGHHTIFLPEDNRAAFAELFEQRRVPNDLPFYVSIPSATDPELAPPDHSSVFVLVPVPLLSEMPDADWPAVARAAKAAVLARSGLKESDIVCEEIWTPEDWRRQFGLHDGSAFGAAHTLFQMGPFRTRNYSRSIAGMYYVGAGTTPGTGMPMVVLGGRMTAERIASHVH